MATLKEHQAAMVDLLANGSGIPASASRLAHAMHDVLNLLASGGYILNQSATVVGEQGSLAIQIKNLIDEPANPTPALKELTNRRKETTPGLNDKALSKREKALKTDSLAKWPTPAEQRVKELENTIRQLKANNAKLKADKCELEDQVEAYRRMAIPEQAGCRKQDVEA